MKPGGGKAKGAEFERHVCKRLSLWMSDGEREDLFWRSAMSGGRATLQNRKGVKNKTQEGDITSLDPLGHLLTDEYVIECKFLKTLDAMSFLLRGSGGMGDAWTVLKTASKNGKGCLLVAKENRRVPVVLIQPPLWNDNATIFFQTHARAEFTFSHGAFFFLFDDLLLHKPKSFL